MYAARVFDTGVFDTSRRVLEEMHLASDMESA
jgi:hypothetical protein